MRHRHPSKGEHMKDEALKLALEALEVAVGDDAHDYQKYLDAITAIKQALAQPVQKRPQNCGTGYCSCVECVMEPAPVQEPVAYLCENAVGHKYFRWKKPSGTYKPIALYTTPPAQPAPVQERNFCERCGKRVGGEGDIHTCTPPAQPAPVQTNIKSYLEKDNSQFKFSDYESDGMHHNKPAVPDAFGTREGEHPQYIQGWNDCMAEMSRGQI